MSLILHNNHKAWQQRLSKELYQASKAIQEDKNPIRIVPIRPITPRILINNYKKPVRTTTDFKKYSEVRGKYSRPAPPLNDCGDRPKSAMVAMSQTYDPLLDYLERYDSKKRDSSYVRGQRKQETTKSDDKSESKSFIQTKKSRKSGSVYRKYIEELEKNLEEEKTKRKELEKLLETNY